MFYDILIAIIFLVFLIIGIKRGAVRTIISFLISICSYFLATYLGKIIANWAYMQFIHTSVENAVTSAMNGISASDPNAAQGISSALPNIVKGIISLSGNETSKLIEDAINNSSQTIANAVDSVVKNSVVAFFTFFITIILFIIIRIILKLTVGKLLNGLFKVNGLKQINSFLGAILSIVCAFFFISFLAFLIKLILPFMNGVPDFLSLESINNSYIFKYFYDGNIFSSIFAGIIGGK